MSYVNRGTVLGIGVTFIVGSIAAVGTRFAIRLRQEGLGIDDWLCLAALPLVLGGCVVMIVGYATHSLGTHSAPNIRPWPDSEMAKKLEYCMYMIFVPALVLLKLSTLFFYRRIFRGRAFQITFYCLTVMSVLWGVTFFTAFASACPEVKWFWIAVKSKCADTFSILLVQSILDVVVDLGILILPIPFVFRLQMPMRRKIAACCTLAVGMLAIACGITRMVIFIQTLAVPWLSHPTVAGMRFDDWKGVPGALCIWSMLEMGVAIIAISLPTTRHLIRSRHILSFVESIRSLASLPSISKSSESSLHEHSEMLHVDEVKTDDRMQTSFASRGKSTVSAVFDCNDAAHISTNGHGTVLMRDDGIMVRTTFEVTDVTTPNSMLK